MLRGVSDRAFGKASSHLHMPALTAPNDQVLANAEDGGVVPSWQGLRLVAGEASVLMPAIRQCRRTKRLAAPDQRLFALDLAGAELTLHAAVHSASDSERAMLANALDKRSPGDVLLLDSGYSAAWPVNLLDARGLRFVIRCESTSGGRRSLRQFIRSDLHDATITLTPPAEQAVADWGGTPLAPWVRVVRSIAPNGQVRLLMTNLTPKQAPTICFGALHHCCWGIEDAFRRLKRRLKLKAVSGLSQHALIIDVGARIRADNLWSLMCAAAHREAHAPADRHCAPTTALHNIQRALPRLLLHADCSALLQHTLAMIAHSSRRAQPDRSSPRPDVRSKPHPSMAYKG